jgi:hypothetical protein
MIYDSVSPSSGDDVLETILESTTLPSVPSYPDRARRIDIIVVPMT